MVGDLRQAILTFRDVGIQVARQEGKAKPEK